MKERPLQMVELTREPIDTQALLDRMNSRRAGAVVLFLGTTRELTDGRRTQSLDYDCYPEMARKQLAELEQQARQQWPPIDCAVVHRLGRLDPGEASVAVVVNSPHRRDAFEAARWLIDTIKKKVPIWKRENWEDGESQWVHPGMETPATQADETR